MKYQRFIRRIFVYGIGNVSTAIANFFLIPFYTFFLSTDQFGTYDLIISTATLLMPVLSLQIELALLRWLLTEPDRERIFSNTLAILAISILGFSILYFSIVQITPFRYNGWIFLMTITLSLYSVIRQFIRGIGKNTVYILSDIIYLSLFFIQVLVFLGYLKMKMDGLLIASVISYGITIACLIIYNRIWKNFKFGLIRISYMKSLLKYSVPLIPNAINLLLMSIVLKYVIVWTIGFEFNGIFAVAYKFASLLFLINAIFYLAWQETAIQAYSAGNPTGLFSDVLNIYMRIITLIIIVFVTLQFMVLPLIVEKEFGSIIKYVPILLLGNFFMIIGSFYGVIYQCEKKTRNISISSLLGTLITIATSFTLIGSCGLFWIALSYMLGNLAMMVYRLFDTKKYLKIHLSLPNVILAVAICIIMPLVNGILPGHWYMLAGAIFIVTYIAFNLKSLDKLKKSKIIPEIISNMKFH